MADRAGTALLSWLGLTDEQRQAVQAGSQDLVLTAGPGSGKTRTLVGRYLSLLAEGADLRSIAAITFTEKAANEMRSRIRRTVADYAASLTDAADRAHWLRLAGRMESARISTIHGLCAEILRAHPVEAGLDPEFEVVDEADALLLHRAAIEAAMVNSIDDPVSARVFQHASTFGLQRLLEFMLSRRLDFPPGQAQASETEDQVSNALLAVMQMPAFAAAEITLEELRQSKALGTESMADMAEGLLSRLRAARESIEAGEPVAACQVLFEARRQFMRGNIGQANSPAKQAVAELRAVYDDGLQPWLGGASSQDAPPDPELEASYQSAARAIWGLYQAAAARYQAALESQAAVDFDGLEHGALALLGFERVRTRWQKQLDFVLVDEFQDTNQRQVGIVQALTADRPGKLFVVGDARQSIYRFRGADVASFMRLAQQMQSAGNQRQLRQTWRHHPGLLQVYQAIFPPVFASLPSDELESSLAEPMVAVRGDPPQMQPPYLHFVLGLGEDAEAGRQVAAAQLADWLVQQQQAGQIDQWDEVALLFRASSGFSHYEDAFEAWGIPYVTVAGRGFFQRPEIREVLNALRALAAPWDDRAMAGLLRASWIGLSDQALYRLRIDSGRVRRLRMALVDPSIELDPGDEIARQRARDFLDAFAPQVERIPVADLLKGIADWTSARAVLAIGGERMWSNLDKLIADARDSERVRIRAFLDYLGALRDAGVREGEAVADARSAVRLMTVHRAKGLEFPLVVLADAAYRRPSWADPAIASEAGPPAFKLDRWSGQALAYRLAAAQSAAGDRAEEARLLYVALTRSKESVVISGHLTQRGERVSASGWLAEILQAIEVEAQAALQPETALSSAAVEASLALHQQAADPKPWSTKPAKWPRGSGARLTAALDQAELGESGDRDEDQLERMWRVTGRRRPPATVIGLMVHYALERWMLPPDPGLDDYLELRALSEGLVRPDQRSAAVRLSKELLSRLRDHPLAAEIEASPERRHEVPYAGVGPDGRPDSGAFDLLLRSNGGWRLIDFKTDAIRSPQELAEATEQHRLQLQRYLGVARSLLQGTISGEIVFLDNQGQVEIVPIGQV